MDFCIKNQLWVSVAHIIGTISIEADKQSRVLEDATDLGFFFLKLLKDLENQAKISLLLQLR